MKLSIMKVLQINKLYYPHLGGVETVVKNIAEGLGKDSGIEMRVLACQEKGRGSEEVVNGVKVIRATSWGRLWSLPISFSFFKIAKKQMRWADTVLIHQPFPLASLAQLFWGKNKKIIILYHADIYRQKLVKWFFNFILRFNLRQAQEIIVSSHNLVKNSPLLKPLAAKCRVIYFGINQDDFTITDDIRKEAKKINKSFGGFILAVGRLVYYKGFRYLILAMKQVNCRLLIIGAGPEKDILEKLIIDNNLQERITILDPVSDLRPYYLASKFFVFPSCEITEAFGLVQAEAMFCGKAVVNTNLPTGVSEVSLDGLTGITVPGKDPLSLAAAINKLLNSPELLLEYEKRALKRAQENFTLNTFLEKLRKELIS